MTLPHSASNVLIQNSTAKLLPRLEQIKAGPTLCGQFMTMIGKKRMNDFDITPQKFFHSRNEIPVSRNKGNDIATIGVRHIKHFSRNLRINAFFLRTKHRSIAKGALCYFMVSSTCTARSFFALLPRHKAHFDTRHFGKNSRCPGAKPCIAGRGGVVRTENKAPFILDGFTEQKRNFLNNNGRQLEPVCQKTWFKLFHGQVVIPEVHKDHASWFCFLQLCGLGHAHSKRKGGINSSLKVFIYRQSDSSYTWGSAMGSNWK